MAFFTFGVTPLSKPTFQLTRAIEDSEIHDDIAAKPA